MRRKRGISRADGNITHRVSGLRKELDIWHRAALFHFFQEATSEIGSQKKSRKHQNGLKSGTGKGRFKYVQSTNSGGQQELDSAEEIWKPG